MLKLHNVEVSVSSTTIVSIKSLTLAEGRRLGLVGESGSGKTMTALAIAGLLPRELAVSGSISLSGRELTTLTSKQWTAVHGNKIGMIFQDPMRALNPMMRVGNQIAESLRIHIDAGRREIRRRVLALMERVQLSNVEALARRYPHQLSGGQRQRIVIAMAVACEPELLIADEPTTALDVTVQEGILQLILELSRERGMALLFVSHDLGVIQTVSEEIAVMYGGSIVERGPAQQVIQSPYHRYTEALIGASPTAQDGNDMLDRPLETIPGIVPSVGQFPTGCPFRGRCKFELDECANDMVTPQRVGERVHACRNPAQGKRAA